jgi:isopentenyl-diphosphate Delta-isomerase
MEQVVWVDKDDKILGKVSRKKAHRDGILHRLAGVILTNKKGQILVQERADYRLDHSAGGHVMLEESYLNAAHRELLEELGINSDKEELVLIGKEIIKDKDQKLGNRYHLFEIFTYQGDPGKLDPNEVKSVFWADPKEILSDMEKTKNPYKYTAGFQKSIRIYLDSIN